MQRNEKAGIHFKAPIINYMDLNHIQLSGTQLADLYRNQLVSDGKSETIPVAAPAVTAEIAFKGKNRKQFLWLVEVDSHPFLSDADFQFLTQVLEACKLNIEDIALVNLNRSTYTTTALIAQFQPGIIITSGLNKQLEGFGNEDYLVRKHDHIYYLSTESLEEVRGDKSKKSRLWTGLKEMLGL